MVTIKRLLIIGLTSAVYCAGQNFVIYRALNGLEIIDSIFATIILTNLFWVVLIFVNRRAFRSSDVDKTSAEHTVGN